MPLDNVVRIHPADRNYLHTPMLISALFRGIVFLVAVTQLIDPEIRGNRSHRFLIFATVSAALRMPYPCCLWQLRRRIVLRTDGLEFHRGNACAFVGWDDVAGFYPSEHRSNVYGESLREAVGAQRDLRLRFTTRDGVEHGITNEFEDVERPL